MTTVLQFPVRQQRVKGESADRRIDTILRTRMNRVPNVGPPGHGAARSKAIRDVFRRLGWAKYFRVLKGGYSLGTSIEWAKDFRPSWECSKQRAAREVAGRAHVFIPVGVCGCDTCRYREAQRDAVRRRVHYVLNRAFAGGTREFGDRSDSMTDYFDADYTFHP